MLVLLGAEPCLSLAPNFIVAPATEAAERSRNEVKEDFGNSLHVLVDTAARVQMAAGKSMMMLAALQRSAASQAAALVEDRPPFDVASTDKLAQAQALLEAEVSGFEKILAELGDLTIRVGDVLKLESHASASQK